MREFIGKVPCKALKLNDQELQNLDNLVVFAEHEDIANGLFDSVVGAKFKQLGQHGLL